MKLYDFIPSRWNFEFQTQDNSTLPFSLELDIDGCYNLVYPPNYPITFYDVICICKEIFDNENLCVKQINITYLSLNQKETMCICKTKTNKIQDYYEIGIKSMRVQ